MSKLVTMPIVSICCTAYNKEKYIKDAIEGFLAQKTIFPVEIVIGEDCSTDGTRAIIKSYAENYPEKIHPLLHEKNLGLIKNFSATINACNGKYIALCDADDYWTDPMKLQKQVDFLEQHTDCSICGHKVLFKYEDHEEKNHFFPNIDGNRIFTKEDMYGKYIAQTSSIVFRRQKISDFILYLSKFKALQDIPLYYFYVQLGNFGYIDEVMGTYRIALGDYWYFREEREKVPILFDMFVKIKTQLKIRGKNGVGGSIIYYALELLKVYYSQKNYQKMREVIKRSIPSLNSADKKQARKFLKYALIAVFPSVTKFMKSTIIS